MRRSGDADRETPARQTPKSRDSAESKLRRDRRHCPLCLKVLPRIVGGGRLAHKCSSCGAQPQARRRCAKCRQEAIWELGAKAACQACANHGSKLRVVAGALEEAGSRESR
jgi:hypothetical protein